MNERSLSDVEELLHSFPVIEPPATISEEALVSFSAQNKALNAGQLKSFFSHIEFDEFTELVPCCSWPISDKFYTLIYWKATLMRYEFYLMTLDKKGHFISEKVIAGTLSNGQTTRKAIAHFNEENEIYVAVGESTSDNNVSLSNQSAFKIDILPDGEISSSLEDINLWEENENQAEKN